MILGTISILQISFGEFSFKGVPKEALRHHFSFHCSQLVQSAKSQVHQGNFMLSIDGGNFMDYKMLKASQHHMMQSVLKRFSIKCGADGVVEILNNLIEK